MTQSPLVPCVRIQCIFPPCTMGTCELVPNLPPSEVRVMSDTCGFISLNFAWNFCCGLRYAIHNLPKK